jgi:hypothetical protein
LQKCHLKYECDHDNWIKGQWWMHIVEMDAITFEGGYESIFKINFDS